MSPYCPIRSSTDLLPQQTRDTGKSLAPRAGSQVRRVVRSAWKKKNRGKHEPARSQLDQLCEDSIKVTFSAGIQHMEFQPEGIGRCLHFLCGRLGKRGISRVDEQGHDARRGDQLMQQLQPLRCYFRVRLGYARDVAARTVKACNEAEPKRVVGHFEDNRNSRGRRLCRKRRRSAGCCNHGYLPMNQISHQRRQPIILAPRPAVFDRHIVAFNVTGFAQPFDKGRQLSRVTWRRSGINKPDHWHRRLRRPRCKRPRSRHTAKQSDELTPPHSITSSALVSSDGGTVRLRALAVLRLITSSYLVGACTGRSAGFSPFRMRST